MEKQNEKEMKKIKKNERGITLIALVITVIVLLILAGVSIATLTGENGILTRANDAKNKTELTNEKEQFNLGTLEGTIQKVETNTTISYTWEQLSKIAKEISNNSNTITKDTEKATVMVDGNICTLLVGDTTVVKIGETPYKVRILGFNHDKLEDMSAYGGNNTYAGISFEFVDLLPKEKMNEEGTNEGGWESSKVNTLLNTTILETLNNNIYIKPVKKDYIKIYNDASSVTEGTYSLWLLSCTEIWNNKDYGTKGYPIAKEGKQYKYYEKINATYNINNSQLVKNSSWWLRSPRSNYFSGFCHVTTTGSFAFNNASEAIYIAPCFSV